MSSSTDASACAAMTFAMRWAWPDKCFFASGDNRGASEAEQLASVSLQNFPNLSACHLVRFSMTSQKDSLVTSAPNESLKSSLTADCALAAFSRPTIAMRSSSRRPFKSSARECMSPSRARLWLRTSSLMRSQRLCPAATPLWHANSPSSVDFASVLVSPSSFRVPAAPARSFSLLCSSCVNRTSADPARTEVASASSRRDSSVLASSAVVPSQCL
mmetsp:Transcript_74807/g.150466  ORF Transcript_74807/g.150466 Transcript_74807/m.150466 type:complete len:216 (-) Transcript_74807:1706-2353(-)